MIKNIVFDLGKVLINFNSLEYLQLFKFDDNTNKILSNLIFHSEEWKECDAGKYSKNTDIVGLLCEKNPDYAEKIRLVLTENWVKMLTKKEDTISFLEDLKKRKYRIYVLSNISEESHRFICNYDFF